MSQIKTINYNKICKAILVAALFLNPALNQAAIAPLYPTGKNLKPADFMNIEIRGELSEKKQNQNSLQFQYSMIKYDKASQDMDLQETARIALQMKKEIQFDPSEVIPLNMPENSSDSSYIAGKVLRHAAENWYDNSDLKKSDWGRATSGANKDLEAALLGANNSQLSFKMRALTGRAQLKYKGAVEASLTYEAFDNDVKFEVTRKMNESTTLVFHSVENTDGLTNEVGFRYHF